MIDQTYLKQLVTYDPATGIFRWRYKYGHPEIGGNTSDGYRKVKIKGQMYRVHRLAFLYMNGSFPTGDVDHIDQNRSNNAWSNLREATRGQNRQNLKGVKNVRWDGKRWLVRIGHQKKLRYVGRFDSYDDAVTAKISAEKELFTHTKFT